MENKYTQLSIFDAAAAPPATNSAASETSLTARADGGATTAPETAPLHPSSFTPHPPSSPIPWPAAPSRTEILRCDLKTARAHLSQDAIVIRVPRDWPDRETRKAVRTLKAKVTNRLRQPLLRELVERINRETVNVEITDVQFTHRQNRSRIGSINYASGRMRLSHRIADVEPEVLRYLIVHELVHMIHHDHGPAFWAEVGRHVPDYKPLRRRLQEHFARPRRA